MSEERVPRKKTGWDIAMDVVGNYLFGFVMVLSAAMAASTLTGFYRFDVVVICLPLFIWFVLWVGLLMFATALAD